MFLRLFACFILTAAGGWLSAVAEKTDSPGSLVVFDDSAANTLENTPRGSAAFQLAARNKRFLWQPTPDGNPVHPGAAITGIALAPDESLLVLGETLGNASGPNSCRIVLFNLLSGKIVNAFDLPDIRLGEFRFLPGSWNLIAAERAQKTPDRPPRLVLISLKKQQIIARSEPLRAEVLSFATDGEELFYTLEGQPDFFQLPVSRLEALPQAHRIKLAPSRVGLTPDGKTLLHFGPGHLRRYALEEGRIALQDSELLPEDFSPLRVVALDDAGKQLLMLDGKVAVLRRQGISQELQSRAGVLGCARSSDGSFVFSVPLNESLMYYGPKNAPPVSASPRKLKPFNRNNTLFFTLLSDAEPELLLVDHRANVVKLLIRPRRWEKKELLSPWK